MKIYYFAWVREKTGIDQEDVELPDTVTTVADLIQWLKSRGPQYESAFKESGVVRAAIDQSHVKQNASVKGASEIAFFPPVTGG